MKNNDKERRGQKANLGHSDRDRMKNNDKERPGASGHEKNKMKKAPDAKTRPVNAHRRPVLIEVANRADLNRFIDLPQRIYRDDPAWVPPFRAERKFYLSRRLNPFFESAETRMWLALRDHEPVGRIVAIYNREHIAAYPQEGQFGMIEAIDDAEIFAALLDAAAQWLRERGMKSMIGPFDLSINHQVGMLIDGFATPPMALMGHAPPYYRRRMEEAGCVKAMDIFAYRRHPGMTIELPVVVPPSRENEAGQVEFASDDLKKKSGVHLWARRVERSWSGFLRDLNVFIYVFNKAWVHNWRFLPLKPRDRGMLMFLFMLSMRRDWMWIGFRGNAPVAIACMIADFNEAAQGLKGRLWPFGWLKFLWRLKAVGVKGGRVAIFGIVREAMSNRENIDMAGLLIRRLNDEAHIAGFDDLEVSWILENNRAVCSIFDFDPSSSIVKTYRVYARDIA